MAEDHMSTAQALGVLRRARQTLRFLEGVEEAAIVISRYQEQMGGLEQALIDKRQELLTVEHELSTKEEAVLQRMLSMELEFTAAKTAHDDAILQLALAFERKQSDVAIAKANEDDDYLLQARQHETQLAKVQASIQEREGYLARLNERIGALRADLDSVREA